MECRVFLGPLKDYLLQIKNSELKLVKAKCLHAINVCVCVITGEVKCLGPQWIVIMVGWMRKAYISKHEMTFGSERAYTCLLVCRSPAYNAEKSAVLHTPVFPHGSPGCWACATPLTFPDESGCACPLVLMLQHTAEACWTTWATHLHFLSPFLWLYCTESAVTVAVSLNDPEVKHSHTTHQQVWEKNKTHKNHNQKLNLASLMTCCFSLELSFLTASDKYYVFFA